MSILQTLSTNGETEPKRWGSYELLPLPAQQRLHVVLAATRAVEDSMVVQAGVSARSQRIAAKEVDKVLGIDPVAPTTPQPVADNFSRPENTINAVTTRPELTTFSAEDQNRMIQAASAAINRFHDGQSVNTHKG